MPEPTPRKDVFHRTPKNYKNYLIKKIEHKSPKDDFKDPFAKPKKDPALSLEETLQVLRGLKSAMPISVQGMQVLDENGDVRFQVVCEPSYMGLEYR